MKTATRTRAPMTPAERARADRFARSFWATCDHALRREVSDQLFEGWFEWIDWTDLTPPRGANSALCRISDAWEQGL